MTSQGLSARQVFWMLIGLNTSAMLLLSIRGTITIARQDSWISMLIGGVVGIGITFVAVRLSLMFPTQTFVEYSQTILGKWLGKLIVVPYFLMGAGALCVILRQLTDFVHMAWLHRTPLWVVILGMVWLIWYITYAGGITGIARCAGLIGPILLLTVAVVVMLSWGNFHFEQILPVYSDTGWKVILNGSWGCASFFGQSILMVMILSFMKRPNKAMKYSLLAMVIVSITLTLSIFFIISTFGVGLASEMLYPAYEVTRYVSVLDFLQSIDLLIVLIWILGYFIQLSLYFFFVSYSIGQWLGIQKWERITWFVAALSFVGALLPRGYNFASVVFPKEIWTDYVFPINMVALPLLLWGIAIIRKRIFGTLQ